MGGSAALRLVEIVKRGDIVTAAFQGNAGKPRPALVVQAEELFAELETIVVLPLTSDLADFPLTRVTIEPNQTNGLRTVSQVMVARPNSPERAKIGSVIGRAGEPTMLEVERKLAVLLGLAA